MCVIFSYSQLYKAGHSHSRIRTWQKIPNHSGQPGLCVQAVLLGGGGMSSDESFSRQHVYIQRGMCFWGDLVLVGIKTSARRIMKGALFVREEMRKCMEYTKEKKYPREQQGTVCHNFLAAPRGSRHLEPPSAPSALKNFFLMLGSTRETCFYKS